MMTEKILKVALIGAGGVVMAKHAEAYDALSERFCPWVICDPSDENRKHAALRFGVPAERCVASLGQLAAFRADVDFAIVATPVSTHAECVQAAARLGWHVLCEKPLAMNLAEVDAMIQATREAGVLFGVIHNLYHMNITGDCLESIRAGRLGDIRLVRCESHSSAWKAGEWRANKAVAGFGHFFDCLYHELYLTRAAVGSPVTRVYAQVANLTCHDITVEDTVLCLLEFANGAMASLQDCKAFRGRGVSVFETHGTKGSIVRNLPVSEDRRWLFTDSGLETVPPADTSSGGDVGVFRSFAESVSSGKPLDPGISAAEDGRENLRVLLAAYESGEKRAPVVLA
jgi:predicted dehydrogenase